MATTDETAAPSGASADTAQVAWHALEPGAVTERLHVSPASGLSGAEAASRLASVGPNKFAEVAVEPRWRAFVRQYRDPMQIVLLVAGIGSLYPLKELGTGLVLLFLTLFNAVLGLRQEGKAAEAVAALQKMMIIKARVRRDGELLQIPAEELVPGDIVSIEAGDLVPADGRLLSAATLEIAEAALTGESLPVSKGVESVGSPDTPLGDRTDMVFMNTNVTRGSGTFVVTTTGMATEVGHISHMLQSTDDTDTPLTIQLKKLTSQILVIAGAAVADLGHLQPLARPELRHRLHRGDRVRDLRDPDRSARRRHDDPLVRDADAREGERDHEAAPLDRDARLDVGDQLRQDRDADAEPDDGGRDDDPRPALHDLRRRLLDGGHDQARLRAARGAARAVPPADGAVRRRGRQGRRAGGRPDRGRPRRAGREGRPRRGRDAAGLPARRRAAVRLRVQDDGDVPRDAGRERPRRRPLPRQGRPGPAARARGASGPLPRTSPPCPSTTTSSSATWTRTSGSQPGPARDGDRPEGLRSGRVRSVRRPASAARRDDGARAGRDRRSAAPGGEGGDRGRARGRHPGAHDHRRSRRDGRSDRGRARHRRPGDQRRGVQGDVRQRARRGDRRDRRDRARRSRGQGAPRRER